MPTKERFSTTTRLRLLGEQAVLRVSERVYRARPPRRSRLTGRAALLALVVCSLVVALAYPVRQYVSQRAEIAEQEQEAEEARRRVEQLRDEKARWQDDAYVRREAREHLHYVLPGEVGYVLPSGARADAPGEVQPMPADRAWYTNLWAGVDAADSAGGRRR